MNTVSYSASYTNSLHSFKIMGLPEGECKDNTLMSFTCIIMNILQRSRVVRPSAFLKGQLGEIQSHNPEYAYINMNAPLPVWDATIKGANNGDNPAHGFFYDEELWERFFPEYSWVRYLLIPEASIETILEDNSGAWESQTVDFYLPAAKLVMEIDGGQHFSDLNQRMLDKRRNNALYKKGVDVIRIPTWTLRDSFTGFEPYAEQILDKFEKTKIKELYLESAGQSEQIADLVKYEKVIRYQFTLLSLIQRGAISFNQKVWQFDIPEEERCLFSVALEDLNIWYSNLYKLKGVAFEYPDVEYGMAENAWSVRIDLFNRPDETEKSGIYICTDLWDCKDYFTVACGELVDYDIPWPLQEDTPQHEALLFFLNEFFSYPKFKQGQLPIIINALNLKKTIGILPTGGGKSLCYQFAALLQPAISFVVCPIISLLVDQKVNFDGVGVTRTDFIASSGKTVKEKEEVINKYASGRLLLIWIAPERFQSEKFRFTLHAINYNFNFAYAVIDEVHCLSEWGHDFRTSYLTLIGTIENYCPQATIIGLTATASQAVLQDLKIEFGEGVSVRALPSLERPNLSFEVRNVEQKEKINELCNILQEHHYGEMNQEAESGIVFALTRRTKEQGCETICRNIGEEHPEYKKQIGVYHSSIPDKIDVQKKFMDNHLRLLCATSAFGMGVNKTDVRFTVHYGLPKSVEAFYQEAGRAGRDDNPAECYILLSPQKLEEDVLKTAFSRESSPEQISECKIGGDIGTILHLWKTNNEGVDTDVSMIKKLVSRLRYTKGSADSAGQRFCIVESEPYGKQEDKNNSEQIKQEKFAADKAEKALYRLKQLGIVEDWTIDWRGNYSRYKVYYDLSLSEAVLKDNLYRYIRRYSPTFPNPNKNYDRKCIDILNEKNEHYIYRYARALISWTYDNISYLRRQAIKNIMEFCTEYSDKESFRQRIDDFLKVTDQTIILDSLLRDSDKRKWQDWISVFYEWKVDDNGQKTQIPLPVLGISSLRDSVARYMESYRDVTGLNLVYALSCVISDHYSSAYEGEILSSALGDIPVFFAESKHKICNRILRMLQYYRDNIVDDSSIEDVAARMLRVFPEENANIHEHLGDSHSLISVLQETINEINEAVGRIL